MIFLNLVISQMELQPFGDCRTFRILLKKYTKQIEEAK